MKPTIKELRRFLNAIEMTDVEADDFKPSLLAALDVAEANLDRMTGKTAQFVVDGLTLTFSTTIAPSKPEET